MSVKIMIKRHVPVDKVQELTPLLRDLRALATKEPAYISGETLRRVDDQGEYLVISTWRSLEDWNRWIDNDQRKVLQARIDTLLGRPTEYAVYRNIATLRISGSDQGSFLAAGIDAMTSFPGFIIFHGLKRPAKVSGCWRNQHFLRKHPFFARLKGVFFEGLVPTRFSILWSPYDAKKWC